MAEDSHRPDRMALLPPFLIHSIEPTVSVRKSGQNTSSPACLALSLSPATYCSPHNFLFSVKERKPERGGLCLGCCCFCKDKQIYLKIPQHGLTIMCIFSSRNKKEIKLEKQNSPFSLLHYDSQTCPGSTVSLKPSHQHLHQFISCTRNALYWFYEWRINLLEFPQQNSPDWVT